MKKYVKKLISILLAVCGLQGLVFIIIAKNDAVFLDTFNLLAQVPVGVSIIGCLLIMYPFIYMYLEEIYQLHISMIGGYLDSKMLINRYKALSGRHGEPYDQSEQEQIGILSTKIAKLERKNRVIRYFLFKFLDRN